jgi:signal transduction histidine kinase
VSTAEKVLSPGDIPVVSRRKNRFNGGDRAVVVEITDTGPGIPEDKLDKLFDPFFTTKPTGQGTGLGLSITRKIIDLHDAVIDIRNREGGGVAVNLLFRADQRRSSP